MKKAKELRDFYQTKIDEAHEVEEMRDLATLLLDMVVALKAILEAKEIDLNPLEYQKCTGKGVISPWIVCVDHIDSNKAVGVCGGASISQEQFDLLREGQSQDITLFRLYDDDDILYYEGRMVIGDEGNGFEPLDDFGEPNAGCTRVDLFNDVKREWELL